jgi:hypothetical protein
MHQNDSAIQYKIHLKTRCDEAYHHETLSTSWMISSDSNGLRLDSKRSIVDPRYNDRYPFWVLAVWRGQGDIVRSKSKKIGGRLTLVSCRR